MDVWNGHAKIDRAGRVTITFDSQGQVLLAPVSETGEARKWLPCSDNCGEILSVSLCVVAVTCDACMKDHDEPEDEPRSIGSRWRAAMRDDS